MTRGRCDAGPESMTASIGGLLAAKGYVLADGAMGTQLFAVGLSAGDPPETWNVHHAEEVRAIHRGYLRAGADLVVTNSFGGTRFRLALHGLQDRVVELNEAAARNCRVEADAETERTGRGVLVAGSMGPTGELLEPMGNMSVPGCEAAFAEQAAGLAAGGADLLWIETMSDLDEVEAAVRGARSSCDLPVAATMSFDTACRTMMGVTGAELAGPARRSRSGRDGSQLRQQRRRHGISCRRDRGRGDGHARDLQAQRGRAGVERRRPRLRRHSRGAGGPRPPGPGRGGDRAGQLLRQHPRAHRQDRGRARGRRAPARDRRDGTRTSGHRGPPGPTPHPTPPPRLAEAPTTT